MWLGGSVRKEMAQGGTEHDVAGAALGYLMADWVMKAAPAEREAALASLNASAREVIALMKEKESGGK
jgi:hypothetical protein